jgi:WD40 repeat protein
MLKQNLHIVINAKGGVGKSFISALLLEYLAEKSNAIGIDTDPNNHSLSDIESLPVTFLNIMPDGDIVDIKKFDDLVMFLLENKKTNEVDVVCDIGAATMQPLYTYLIENDTFELILSQKYNIFLHVPVAVGSEAEADTLLGLENMITAFKDTCTYVVWSNEFFSSSGGNNIEELPQYVKYKEKIFAVVLMKKRDVLFASAIEKMKKAKTTFANVPMDTSFNILEKSRLTKVRNDYWDILDVIIPTAVSKKEEDKK